MAEENTSCANKTGIVSAESAEPGRKKNRQRITKPPLPLWAQRTGICAVKRGTVKDGSYAATMGSTQPEEESHEGPSTRTRGEAEWKTTGQSGAHWRGSTRVTRPKAIDTEPRVQEGELRPWYKRA